MINTTFRNDVPGEGADSNLLLNSAAVIAILTGLLVMAGWHGGQATLIQIFPGFAPMQYNTALCFLFSGFGLLTIGCKRSFLCLVIPTIICSISGLTLIEYLLDVDLGIDQLLMGHYITDNTSHPGRMAPNTALCFFLTGIAIYSRLLARKQWRAMGMGISSSFVSALAFVTGLGYCCGIEPAYGWGPYTQMALNTTFCFLVIGISMSIFAWRINSGQGHNLPVWAPLQVALAVLVVTIVLSQSLNTMEEKRISLMVENRLQNMRNELTVRLASQIKALVRKAKRFEMDRHKEKRYWDEDTRGYLDHYKGLQAIGWADSSYQVHWTGQVSESFNDLVRTAGLGKEQLSTLKSAGDHQSPVVSEMAATNAPGEKGFIVHIPIFSEERFYGAIAGFFHARALLDEIFENLTSGFLVSVSDSAGIFYDNYDEQNQQKDLSRSISTRISIYNAEWQLRISPDKAFVAQMTSNLPAVVLVIGILTSVLMAMLVQLWITARDRAKALEKENRNRCKVEEALRESERASTRQKNLLQKIVEQAAEGIIVADLDLNFKVFNDHAKKLLHVDRTDVNPEHWRELYLTYEPDGKTPVPFEAYPLLKSLKGETVKNFDMLLRNRITKQEIITRSNSTPLVNENGKIIGAVITISDITQSKQVEKKIKKLNIELEDRVKKRTAQLEAAYNELEAFSYSVSHDLRAPLRHMHGFVHALHVSSSHLLDEKGNRYVEIISNSAERMGNLIDDLLTFSRMGRTQIRNERVNLNEVIRNVIAELSPEAENRKIEWTIGELPEIHADRSMLHQAFINLIENALKFTRTRAIAKISVSSQPAHLFRHIEQNQIVISVRDNGVGFDMEFADKLFGVFQRLHRRDDFEGTGIGLANVHRIIRRHAGHVWAEAVTGKGATFYFSLPLDKDVNTKRNHNKDGMMVES